MSKAENDTAKLTFEQALNELEHIVKLLEEGNLNLNDSLANFEKGIALSRICSQKLEQAEKKIEVLLKAENDEITLKPVTITEGTDE